MKTIFSIRGVSAMQNRTFNLTCFCDLGVEVSIHLTCCFNVLVFICRYYLPCVIES